MTGPDDDQYLAEVTSWVDDLADEHITMAARWRAWAKTLGMLTVVFAAAWVMLTAEGWPW